MSKRTYAELEQKALETLANGAPTFNSLVSVIRAGSGGTDFVTYDIGEIVDDAQRIIVRGRSIPKFFGVAFTNRNPFVLADFLNNQYPESLGLQFPGGDDVAFGPYIQEEIGVNVDFKYRYAIIFCDPAGVSDIGDVDAALMVERYRSEENQIGGAQ